METLSPTRPLSMLFTFPSGATKELLIPIQDGTTEEERAEGVQSMLDGIHETPNLRMNFSATDESPGYIIPTAILQGAIIEIS